MKKPLSLLIAVLVFTASLSGCSDNPKNFSATKFMLDTAVTVTLYEGGSERILDGCFSVCEKYGEMLGINGENGDIAEINRSGGRPTEVSGDTAELLRAALELSEESGGAFDPTIYPVKLLWDFSAEDPKLPDPAALAEALRKVGCRNITIDGNTVTAANGAGLDLGGIAKGYIADKMKEYLLSEKVGRAVIDLGGNICCVGAGKFKIGIKKPYTSNGILATVSVDGGAVVTSGCYERYFTLNGKRYHHILDPKTGYPADNDLLGVTVICGDSTLADFLSTAVYVKGYDSGCDLLKSKGAEAVFVFEDGGIKLTDGLRYGENGEIIPR